MSWAVEPSRALVAMTAEGMRAYDRHAIEACGIPGLVLMENAGRGAAEAIAARMTAHPGPAVIVCGKGNNGGDGFVVARHLEARGLATEVHLVGRCDDVRGDARQNLEALFGLGVEVVELEQGLGPLEEALSRASVVVDALFGTGLSRPVDGLAAEVVEAMGAVLVPIVALDVPSGLDATTGEVLGVAVRATATLTFGHLKTGLLQGAGVRYAGDVELVGLGLPDGAILDAVGYEAEAVEAADVLLARGFRSPDAHKYRAGNVLVVGGSRGKVGAALLAATAALRGGAGLATIASWPEVVDTLDGRVLEVMTFGLDRDALAESVVRALERRHAVVLGPGLGLDDPARELVRRTALQAECPAVLDADSLSVFAGRPEDLGAARGVRVLTPHGGELAHLLDTTAAAIERDRFGAARRTAARTRAIVVLKGPHTVIAHPDGRARFVHGALPALATAGAGDVLAGLTGALLVGPRPRDGAELDEPLERAFDAACAAAFVHLSAARRALGHLAPARGRPDRGLLAGDVVEALPAALADL